MTANDDSKEQSTGKTRRRKGRFRRWLIILLIFLAALVWSGPYLASTDMARDMVVSAVNSRIYGTIRIDDLSLSWLGPCHIDGLRVKDTSGREVLEVERITFSAGALRGLTGLEDFGHVEVVKPRPNLIFGVEADGRISVSIDKALQLRKPSEKPPPKPTGRITIRDGFVRMVLPTGMTGSVSGLEGEFHLNTLKDVTGKVSWDWAEIYNLAFGKAEFTPTYRNDCFDLPITTIPVWACRPPSISPKPPVQKSEPADGFLHLRCAIDLSGPEPVLKIPNELRLVENVPINREIGNDLLSRIIAIFYEPERLTGHVSLVVRDIDLPLGDSIEHTGSGSGCLVLKDVKIQAGGLLTSLTKLGGMAAPTDMTTMRISDLNFRIDNGWFKYDNLATIFAETFDTKYSGKVGIIRDELDLKVSLPIFPMQLDTITNTLSPEKVGAKIGMEDLGRVLGKLPLPILGSFPLLGRRHVEIYLTGTRAEPAFDLQRTFEALLKPKPILAPIPGVPALDETLKNLLDNMVKPRPKPPASKPKTGPES